MVKISVICCLFLQIGLNLFRTESSNWRNSLHSFSLVFLGFPCGERLRALDQDKLVHSLFLTWTIGRFDLDEETERTSTSAEEHLMDCHAEEAVEEQSESESEPSGGRARIGRMYSSRGRVTAEFE